MIESSIQAAKFSSGLPTTWFHFHSLPKLVLACCHFFKLRNSFFFFLNMFPIIFIPPDSLLTFSLLRSLLTLLDIDIFAGIYTANYWACFWSWKEGWWERWHLADNRCIPSQGNSSMSLALFLPLEVQKHGHVNSSSVSQGNWLVETTLVRN